MQTYRSSILPIFAIIITILSISYSACHESKAEQKPSNSTATLTQEIARFDQELSDLKTIHANHIKAYSDEMGCTKDSKALEIINQHKALLKTEQERLDYHKLQIMQGDTSNVTRNNAQIEELKKDFEKLEADGHAIRTGFDNFVPAHVTK